MNLRGSAALVGMVALAAAYVAGARLGFFVAPAHQVVSSAWPPAGIALAALVLFGVRLWPGVIIGAFIANYTSGVPMPASAAIALGNTLEAASGVWLLGLFGFRPVVDRVRDVLALTAVAVVSTALSASIGVAALWQAGSTDQIGLSTLWFAWWSGDAIGILVVGGIALAWLANPVRVTSMRAAVEPVLLILALAVLTGVVMTISTPYAYPIFPVAGLVAYRLGPRGATVANLTVAGVTAYFTITGVGAFVAPTHTSTQNAFFFQAFIALLAITTLTSAAVLAERRRAEGDLRASEARLSEAQAVAQLGSWSWEPATRRVVWSNELYRIFGLDRMRFRPSVEGFLERVHPDDRELVTLTVRRAHDQRGAFQIDQRILRPNGEVRVLDSRARVVLDDAGMVVMVGICQDVTELRHAQRTLAESEAKFATLFHASPLAICVIALDKVEVIDSNRRFCEMLGHAGPEGLIGVSPRALGMWAEPGELRDLLARLRLQGSIRETPVKYETREGQPRRALAALERLEIGGVECAVALYWRL